MHNIWDGRCFGLLQAIRAMQLRKYNLILLTKTKILDVVYSHNCLGYDILFSHLVGTTARGVARGGGPDPEGEAGGMYCQTNALPRAECGEL